MAKIRKVLVVDNNATIVELVSAHLAANGYEVAKAYDGLQALDRWPNATITGRRRAGPDHAAARRRAVDPLP
jgi:CheY-like chemotaxis protein